MNYEDYNVIADRHRAIKHKSNNCVIAFLSGGVVGAMGEITIELLIRLFDISRTIASSYMIMIFIFIGCLFTALGFFDSLVRFFKSGLLIPITGFAHSMTSSFMDYREEGFIYGIGSNAFKLAGSVIVYGILSAWFFGIIRFFIGG